MITDIRLRSRQYIGGIIYQEPECDRKGFGRE